MLGIERVEMDAVAGGDIQASGRERTVGIFPAVNLMPVTAAVGSFVGPAVVRTDTEIRILRSDPQGPSSSTSSSWISNFEPPAWISCRHTSA